MRLQSTQSGYARSWTIGPNVGANGFFVIRDSTAGENRLAIDSSGNLLVGTTSQFSGSGIFPKVSIVGTDGLGISGLGSDKVGLATKASSTANYYAGFFLNSSSTGVGNITVSTTATAYNTASDYRLKKNVQPMAGALAKVASLKPCTYNWKSTGEASEGFIAHELAEVVPQCVTGEKDAVDAEGKPIYQGIDTSFLVATLTAAIQEQQSIIQSLTARITALEGA